MYAICASFFNELVCITLEMRLVVGWEIVCAWLICAIVQVLVQILRVFLFYLRFSWLFDMENSSTSSFACSYCKGQDHFKSHCFKRITKNPTDNVCREYNRFEHAQCEFSNDCRSCLHARLHLCVVWKKPECKAYYHIFANTVESDHGTTITIQILRATEQLSKNVAMLWSRTGYLTAQIMSITSHLFRLDEAVSDSPVSATPSSSSTGNILVNLHKGVINHYLFQYLSMAIKNLCLRQ